LGDIEETKAEKLKAESRNPEVTNAEWGIAGKIRVEN
jgi:hypothetical protein